MVLALLVEPACPAGVPTEEEAPVSVLCELVELEADFGELDEFWSLLDDEELGEALVELEELGLEDVEDPGVVLLDCDP